MSGDDDGAEARVSIINAVKSPLGFFTLVILVLESFLVAASAATQQIPMWMPFAIMALLIVCVVVLAWVRPELVGAPQPERHVTMRFPDGYQIDFDDDSGEMVVRPKRGLGTRTVFTPSCNEEGSWFHTLPHHVGSDDQIRITVNDTQARKWRTTPFIPRSITREMNLVVEGGGA